MRLETKYCPRCENTLPVADFNRCRFRKDGLQYRCRACEKNYRAENRERIAARDHVDYRVNRARYRAYFLANRERLNADRRRRRAASLENRT